MTNPVSVLCPKCKASAGDQCRDRYARPKPTCKERERAARLGRPVEAAGPAPEQCAAPPKPAPSADGFDETTPPPRVRPQGVPVGCDVVLGPGEDVRSAFEEWDRAGRVPARSLLCEHVGVQPFGSGQSSGYRLRAVGEGVGAWPDDRELSLDDLAAYRIAVWVAVAPSSFRKYVVFSPMEGT